MPNSGHNWGWHMDIKKVLTTPEAPYWRWEYKGMVHVVGYLMTGAATFCGVRPGSTTTYASEGTYTRTTCLTCLAKAPERET